MPITDPRMLQHPGLQPLWDSMDRDRRQQQYAAVGLILLALFFIVVGVTSRRVGWALVGGLTAAAALWWFFRVMTEQPLAGWRRRLRDQPESIVWVYGLVTERMPFGFKTAASGTLYLVDDTGETHTFGLLPEELKLVTKTLSRILPRAEFGYTKEKELQYRGEVTNFKGRDSMNKIT